jgi:hypothetical protein
MKPIHDYRITSRDGAERSIEEHAVVMATGAEPGLDRIATTRAFGGRSVDAGVRAFLAAHGP